MLSRAQARTLAVRRLTVESVLVANRGEIAVRIIRACAELGLRSIAVYSDADRDAPHVMAADEAVRIGAAPARISYLDIDAVVDAARRTRADAIHPGYGFLSENAGLAHACAAESLVFVGPPADVIERMGSKRRARVAAAASDVDVVPGYHGNDQGDLALIDAADALGYPLMIKASAGGGGRGIRRVYRREEFAAALVLARDEADAAFGDSTVLLERLVGNGRHVEVQILADAHGHVVHLHDRDCSVQRNHQKLIEEAPAPHLPDSVRQSMLTQAVSLSRDIGYVGAGTVEFIYDGDAARCFFLEMNTRLQVEHGVTEEITGVDIVQWQLRIASGEPLRFRQDELVCHGHAIEARVAAEDPADAFRPRSGSIAGYREPGGAGVRIDSGVTRGSRVSHYYDSMLSKVIARGRSREEARRRLVRALCRYEIFGLTTNILFLAEVLESPVFREASHTTSLVAESFPEGWKRRRLAARDIAELVLAALLDLRAARSGGAWQTLGGWRLTAPAGFAGRSWYHAVVDGRVIPVCVSETSGRFDVHVDEALALTVDRVTRAGGELVYQEAGRRRRATVRIDGTTAWHAHCPGSPVEVTSADRVMSQSGTGEAVTENLVRAPMPGVVVELLVAEGDRVASGQTLAVMEAMKMYQELPSPIDGVVAAVRCGAGESVEGRTVLIEIMPAAQGRGPVNGEAQ